MAAGTTADNSPADEYSNTMEEFVGATIHNPGARDKRAYKSASNGIWLALCQLGVELSTKDVNFIQKQRQRLAVVFKRDLSNRIDFAKLYNA